MNNSRPFIRAIIRAETADMLQDMAAAVETGKDVAGSVVIAGTFPAQEQIQALEAVAKELESA